MSEKELFERFGRDVYRLRGPYGAQLNMEEFRQLISKLNEELFAGKVKFKVGQKVYFIQIYRGVRIIGAEITGINCDYDRRLIEYSLSKDRMIMKGRATCHIQEDELYETREQAVSAILKAVEEEDE